jgi:exopolyphosphatase/guanosine-5'-triphosphate,3'-diphosphate pyrophosphatase
LLLDVGGGSTELSTNTFATSLDVGSVRLTERYLHGDPPTRLELARARAAVNQLLPPLTVSDAIGVAGTVGQLAVLAKSDRLSRATVSQLLAGLASLPLEARRRLEGLDPERAPVIVAGAIVVDEVLGHYGLAELRFSVRDLLDGAALEAASLPPVAEGEAPAGAYTCC